MAYFEKTNNPFCQEKKYQNFPQDICFDSKKDFEGFDRQKMSYRDEMSYDDDRCHWNGKEKQHCSHDCCDCWEDDFCQVDEKYFDKDYDKKYDKDYDKKYDKDYDKKYDDSCGKRYEDKKENCQCEKNHNDKHEQNKCRCRKNCCFCIRLFRC